MANREESIEHRHTAHQMYAESNVTSCICHGLGICTLTNIINPSVGDLIYFLDSLHHLHLDWSVCKFQACDRYCRKSHYSPHTSDVQHAYVRYSLLYYNYTLDNGDGSMWLFYVASTKQSNFG